MAAALFFGVRYYLIVFSFAFLMGVLRTLAVAPLIGQTKAVLLEVPIVIAVSWVAARLLLRNISFSVVQLMVSGTTAFALTMASEAALAKSLQDQNFTDWATSLVSPLGLVGVVAQLIFAVMPLLVGLNMAGKLTR